MLASYVRALVVAIAVCATPAMAHAQSPHFVKGPTATLDTTTGDYTVSFKEAGLGNTPITYDLTATSGQFTWQCFTKSGNKPQGSPNTGGFSDLFATTTLSPRNGQITGTLSLVPEQGTASCQGGGLKLCLTAASYEGVTFKDVTDNLTFAMPDLGATLPPPSKQNPGACIE
jgi:hypothetical protein